MKLKIALAMVGMLAFSGQAYAGGWIKAESEHFVVYSNKKTDDVLRFVSELETVYTVTSNYYAPLSDSMIDQPEKMVYNYFNNLSDFTAVDSTARDSFKNTANCADGAFSFWADVDKMGASEYGVFRFGTLIGRVGSTYDAAAMPKWLNTGLTSYLMNTNIENDLVKVGSATEFQFSYNGKDRGQSYSLLKKSDRIPFSDIIADTISRPPRPAAFQAQSWVVVHYLLDHPEYTEKLKAFLDLYRSGTPSAEAWAKTLAIDPESFDGILDGYLKKGINEYTYKVPALRDQDITLTQIPDSGQPVPLLTAAAQTCPRTRDVNRILSSLESAAKTTPNDAYTSREYLRAKVLIGDALSALPDLEVQTKAHPDDYDAHYLLGRAYLRLADSGKNAADYTKARRELGKAYQLNPSSPAGVYYFARAHADQPGYPDDNTLAAATNAAELSGQVWYRLYLAELYARRGMYDDMKTELECYYAPNGDRVVDHVTKQILDAVDAGRSKAEIVSLFSGMGLNALDPYKAG